MLYDLQSLDLDGWHPAENVPQTKALLEQKMLGLTGLEQWYVHLLNVGELPNPEPKNPRWVLSKKLMEDAMANSVRNRYLTPDELGSFMRDTRASASGGKIQPQALPLDLCSQPMKPGQPTAAAPGNG